MIFHTERLRVREINKTDIGHLLEMNNNPNVMAYISTSGFNPSSAEAELKSVIKQQKYYKKHAGFGLWMIDTPLDTVGWISYKYNGDLDGFELGYRLKESYWSKGYMTEACMGLIDYLRKYDVRTFYAVALKENTGSTHVMNKIGMTYYKKDHLYNENVVIYKYVYQ